MEKQNGNSADRKEMEKQAIDIVNKMEASEEDLKNHVSPFCADNTKPIDSLVMNHEEIPDEKFLREITKLWAIRVACALIFQGETLYFPVGFSSGGSS